MNKGDLLALANILNEINDNDSMEFTVRFKYFIAKTKQAIANDVKILQELFKASSEYEKYENKRVAMCELNAMKDENGKAVIKNNEFVMKDYNAYGKEFNKLKKKYNDVIVKEKGKVDELLKILEEEIKPDSLNLTTIDINEMPEMATQKVFDILVKCNFIKEERNDN